MHWKTSPQHRREPDFHFKSMLMGNVAWAFVYLFNFEVLVLSALMIRTYPSAKHLWREGEQEDRQAKTLQSHSWTGSQGTKPLNWQSTIYDGNTLSGSGRLVIVENLSAANFLYRGPIPLAQTDKQHCQRIWVVFAVDVACLEGHWAGELRGGNSPVCLEQNRLAPWIEASYSALIIISMCILLK